MSMHVIGWTVGPERREIVEEHLPEPGHVRIFAGDPRYCQTTERHEPHVHRYEYDRKAKHGGRTRGSVSCDGMPLALPPPPEAAATPDPYAVACPDCGSAPPDPCYMLRAPFDVCAWPHRARRRAARLAAS